jgi:hypothetical protein
VAALYEQGKIHHVGTFPKLEDEMTQWDPLNQVESPNRVDALVHGLTNLMTSRALPHYVPNTGTGFRLADIGQGLLPHSALCPQAPGDDADRR